MVQLEILILSMLLKEENPMGWFAIFSLYLLSKGDLSSDFNRFNNFTLNPLSNSNLFSDVRFANFNGMLFRLILFDLLSLCNNFVVVVDYVTISPPSIWKIVHFFSIWVNLYQSCCWKTGSIFWTYFRLTEISPPAFLCPYF